MLIIGAHQLAKNKHFHINPFTMSYFLTVSSLLRSLAVHDFCTAERNVILDLALQR